MNTENRRSVCRSLKTSSTKLPGQSASVLKSTSRASLGGSICWSSPAACSTWEKVALKSASWTLLTIGRAVYQQHEARNCQIRRPLILISGSYFFAHGPPRILHRGLIQDYAIARRGWRDELDPCFDTQLPGPLRVRPRALSRPLARLDDRGRE